MIKQKITLAILTKNRPAELTRCLRSVIRQTVQPARVLIIDNGETYAAKPVAENFRVKLHILYMKETKPGTAYGRNTALTYCTTPLLGFTDDDCILHKNWTKEATRALSGNKVSYIIGRSLLMNRHHPVAAASYHHHTYWFNKKLQSSGGIPTAFNFDTKNIVLRRDNFLQKKLSFDPNFSIRGVDSSDTDMGFQTIHAGITGAYIPKMIVSHQEITHLLPLLKKAHIRGKLALKLSNKWSLTNEFVDPAQRNFLLFIIKALQHAPHEFQQYLRGYHAPVWHKYTAYLYIKLMERTYMQGYYDTSGETEHFDLANGSV
ncbi:glycosyltransferase family 2 protein [Candidatus Gottesmanbacteria bacterium]|nr:glycosyltransferase family 2 protein [Candidatus Gottesmanbacteria bacterium]